MNIITRGGYVVKHSKCELGFGEKPNQLLAQQLQGNRQRRERDERKEKQHCLKNHSMASSMQLEEQNVQGTDLTKHQVSPTAHC